MGPVVTWVYRCAGAVLVLLGVSWSADAVAQRRHRDEVGTLIVYGPDGQEHSDYEITSGYVGLYSPQARLLSREGERRVVVTTAGGIAPDASLLRWLTDRDGRRRVTLVIADRADPDMRSSYEMTGVTARFSASASSGGGLQTLELQAEHLTINGQRIY